MQEHARAVVGFVVGWVVIIFSWVHGHVPNFDSLLNALDLTLRIALSLLGCISAFYAARYYRRSTPRARRGGF